MIGVFYWGGGKDGLFPILKEYTFHLEFIRQRLYKGAM